MSGIVGILDFGNGVTAEDELGKMLDGMAFFGKDRRGAWTHEGVGLGHLLHRVTPEDAHDQQPLLDQQAGLVLVADCRIDNRDELAHALSISREECRRMSDSAFILRAYLAWGEACPERLLGDFAFAIWDPHRRQLFCARDHLGMRPFMYHQGKGFFAFANGVHGLFALPRIPRRLNENKLLELLVDLHADVVNSEWEGILRLPAGHTMLVTEKGIKQKQYWQAGEAAPIRFANDQDYVEAFLEVFQASIACRLRSSRPVGSTLSGGLDSSSITILAGRMLKAQGKRLPTFSWVPEAGYDMPKGRSDRVFDETPNIRAILDCNENLDATFLSADEKNILDALDRVYAVTQSFQRNCDIPYIWPAIEEQARSKQIGVLLAGGGGNMTISYSGRGLYADMAARGHWLRLSRELRRFAARNNRSLLSVIKGEVLQPLRPSTLVRWHTALKQRQRGHWLASAMRMTPANHAYLTDRFKALGVNPEYRATRDLGDARIRNLMYGPRISAVEHSTALEADAGVVTRHPPLDRRVVDFCLAIPKEQYLLDGQPRALIRRAMAGVLPEQVRMDDKRASQGVDWHRHFDREKAAILSEIKRLKLSDTACRLLDATMLEHLARDWPEEWSERQAISTYRTRFLRGMAMGRFVRWFEGDNG